MSKIQPHALVVGGTGMLREVVYDLVRQGYYVSVVARHQATLDQLVVGAPESSSSINPLPLDWINGGEFTASLQTAVQDHGTFSVAIVWIHGTAPAAPAIVAQFVHGDYFHIRPSSIGSPNHQDPVDVKQLTELTNIVYHDIILGSISTGGSTRWLSNAEIASGVLEAIKVKEKRFIVGEL